MKQRSTSNPFLVIDYSISPQVQGGILPGDLLVSVNGVNVRGMDPSKASSPLRIEMVCLEERDIYHHPHAHAAVLRLLSIG